SLARATRYACPRDRRCARKVGRAASSSSSSKARPACGAATARRASPRSGPVSTSARRRCSIVGPARPPSWPTPTWTCWYSANASSTASSTRCRRWRTSCWPRWPEGCATPTLAPRHTDQPAAPNYSRRVSRPRVKPHQLVLGIGGLLFVITIVSGIAPVILKWLDDSPIQREVFQGIPGPLRAVFYTSASFLFIAGAWLFSLRVRNWERGKPDNRSTTPENAKRRLADFRAGVYMQTLLRDPAAGIMHSLLYFGFLGLFIVTLISQIQDQLPRSLKFLHGRTYQAYSAFGEVVGIAFLAGIVWAVLRRYVWAPYRIRSKSRPEDALILGMFLFLGVSGFMVEAVRIANVGRPGWERWSFVGYSLSSLFKGHHVALYQWLWVGHVAAFFLFLLVLPTTK